MLDEVIEKRIGNHGVGFGAEVTSNADKDTGEDFEQVLPEDLMEYGLIPEFIGRLPVVAAIHQLTRERPDHDPDRAAQRARPPVQALLRVRRHRAGLRSRLARRDRRQGARARDGRPRPSLDPRGDAARRASSSCPPAATCRSASSPRRRSRRASARCWSPTPPASTRWCSRIRRSASRPPEPNSLTI